MNEIQKVKNNVTLPKRKGIDTLKIDEAHLYSNAKEYRTRRGLIFGEGSTEFSEIPEGDRRIVPTDGLLKIWLSAAQYTRFIKDSYEAKYGSDLSYMRLEHAENLRRNTKCSHPVLYLGTDLMDWTNEYIQSSVTTARENDSVVYA